MIADGWEPLRPGDAASLLRGFVAPWWIAGGWALDLDGARRPHADLDVAVLRRDQRLLRAALPGWAFHVAHAGRLEEWDGTPLPRDRHVLWARPRGAERWHLEFLLEDADAGVWRFRRDPRITLPIARLGPPGGPLAPEVVLLYMARSAEERNRADVEATLPRLDDAARAWFEQSLR